MIGALIGAGASLLGGLIGGEESSKSKNKSRTVARSTNRLRLGALVRSAEKNGFNPLTLLRAGGLSAFTDTKSISNTKSKTSGTSSSTSPLGAGIAAAGSAIGGAIDQPNQQAASAADAWQGMRTVSPTNARAEMDLLNQQLGEQRYGAVGTQPRVPVSSTVSAKPALAADPSGGLDLNKSGWITPTYEAPTVTNPMPKNWGAVVDGTSPDADAWETRWGELGGWIGGAYNMARDVGANWQPSVDYLQNHDLPAIKASAEKGAAAVAGYGADALDWAAKPGRWSMPVAGTTNIWDPPAIKQFVRPVVEFQPGSPLGYGGYRYGGGHQW